MYLVREERHIQLDLLNVIMWPSFQAEKTGEHWGERK